MATLKIKNANGEWIEFPTVKGDVGEVDIEALKVQLLQIENPVGHIRLETTNVNPSTFLGFGTWELWGKGKVPVGVDESDSDFNEVEKTGGEKAHTLTVQEMPSHKHTFQRTEGEIGNAMVDDGQASNFGSSIGTTTGYIAKSSPMNESGGGQAHNNLQPYITCYMWKRIS